ncbi:hypothetical protein NPIL_449491 [Nephila pilipes]|uniref:Uncharacterized protein n=1 Tax=Nephila pilipes TaxID=299642 RepID=A0A8X6UMZ4_NEPPI|nr:hypothetical protein NPIL_449491 [Nephila pilipes]
MINIPMENFNAKFVIVIHRKKKEKPLFRVNGKVCIVFSTKSLVQMEKHLRPTYTEHHINKGNFTPVAVMPYRLPNIRKEHLKKKLDNLLQK